MKITVVHHLMDQLSEFKTWPMNELSTWNAIHERVDLVMDAMRSIGTIHNYDSLVSYNPSIGSVCVDMQVWWNNMTLWGEKFTLYVSPCDGWEDPTIAYDRAMGVLGR